MTAHLTSDRKGKWFYRPPTRAVRAGIVEPWVFEGPKATAHYRANKSNQLIKDWKRGKLVGQTLDENSNLRQVAAHYLQTSHFQSLSESTKTNYRSWFRKVLDDFPEVSVPKITTAVCSLVYDGWVRESAANSKTFVRAVGILFSHAIAHGVVERNPMAYVKKVSHTPETVIWSQQQVQKFVETAFSKWQWRSMGIIGLLCYEFAQRPRDIANLRWEDIDWDKRQVTIRQSKRGVTVYVPLSDELLSVLRNQYQDFKFQEWVAPQLRQDNAFRPYTNNLMNKQFRDILFEAGLPEDLKLGKLRNTAITEMVEAGVDITNLKQVTGHRDISSLNPYIKNTLKGATNALNIRKAQ